MRITCDRCGKDRMVNESHATWRDRALRDILKRMRHDGCGGLPGPASRQQPARGWRSVLYPIETQGGASYLHLEHFTGDGCGSFYFAHSAPDVGRIG